MTSNLKKDEVMQGLRPEFINRIDEIITFSDLDKNIIKQIVDLRLAEVEQKLQTQNLTISISDKVREYLVQNGYDPQFGARPVNRIIKRELLSELSKFILENPNKTNVKIKMVEGRIGFE